MVLTATLYPLLGRARNWLRALLGEVTVSEAETVHKGTGLRTPSHLDKWQHALGLNPGGRDATAAVTLGTGGV